MSRARGRVPYIATAYFYRKGIDSDPWITRVFTPLGGWQEPWRDRERGYIPELERLRAEGVENVELTAGRARVAADFSIDEIIGRG